MYGGGGMIIFFYQIAIIMWVTNEKNIYINQTELTIRELTEPNLGYANEPNLVYANEPNLGYANEPNLRYAKGIVLLMFKYIIKKKERETLISFTVIALPHDHTTKRTRYRA
jgi:hypothetical protein